jgi:hypothetical protein
MLLRERFGVMRVRVGKLDKKPMKLYSGFAAKIAALLRSKDQLG